MQSLSCSLFLESHFAKFGFKGRLELLQIGCRGAIAWLLGRETKPACLIELPRRQVAVAEGDFAAYYSSRDREPIHGNGNCPG